MATYRKRGARWHVQIRRKGHPASTKSFLLRIDAEAWARQRELEYDRGEAPQDRSALRLLTFGDLLRRYEASVIPTKKSSYQEGYMARAVAARSVALTRLDKLTPSCLALSRDERLQSVSASSVRREFNLLRHCLEVAIREWNVDLPFNPLKGLRLPPEAPSRERRVTPQELQILATALRKSRNRLLVSVINLAIFTGMRRSELLGLTWRNVDLQRGLAFLPDTKNGHPRHVPLSPAARGVLAGLDQGKPDDLVLPISANAVRLSWERLKRRAEIDNLHFHDLRHEAISRFFEAGLSVPEVSLISGHRDPRMLLRYTHLRPEAVALKLAYKALNESKAEFSPDLA